MRHDRKTATKLIRLRSGEDALPKLRARLRETLSLGIRRPEARTLAILAVEEVVANILEHGYGGVQGRPIAVSVRSLGSDRFGVRVLDKARTMDVTRIQVQDLGASAESLATRGRGLALVRLIASSVTHRPRKGGGNRLDLVFDSETLSRIVEENLREAA